jgi:hypothetical protein
MQQDVLDELGNGYQYVGESRTQKLIHKSVCEGRDSCVSVGVQPCVLDYHNGKRYILASQLPRPAGLHHLDENQFVDTSKNVVYWIIDKDLDSSFGPMDYRAFTAKRSDLNISTRKELETHF